MKKQLLLLTIAILFLSSFSYTQLLIIKKWCLENESTVVTFHSNNTYTVESINEFTNDVIVSKDDNFKWLLKDSCIYIIIPYKDTLYTTKYQVVFIDNQKLMLRDNNENIYTYIR